MPDIDGTLEEIEYLFDQLKVDGIGIYTNTVNELPGLELPRAFELALLRGNAARLFPKFKAKT